MTLSFKTGVAVFLFTAFSMTAGATCAPKDYACIVKAATPPPKVEVKPEPRIPVYTPAPARVQNTYQAPAAQSQPQAPVSHYVPKTPSGQFTPASQAPRVAPAISASHPVAPTYKHAGKSFAQEIDSKDGRKVIRVIKNIRREYLASQVGNTETYAFVPTPGSQRLYDVFFAPWNNPAATINYAANPWLGANTGYYNFYVSYPSPVYWLADDTMGYALAQQYAANPARSGKGQYSPMIDGATKFQLLDQANMMVDAFSKGAPVDLATVLQQTNYIFIMDATADGLTVNNVAGGTCSISGGDLLTVAEAPNANADTAVMTVIAATSKSCVTGSHVVVNLDDLQEMLNSVAAQVDASLQAFKAQYKLDD